MNPDAETADGDILPDHPISGAATGVRFMAWRCGNIEFHSLGAANSDHEYALHRAAVEWSLADSIIINSAQDIKSEAQWRDKLKPFAHQVQNLMTFCRRLPVTLLADDVGLGKTISAGLILCELMTRRRVSRVLIICPSILGPQWVEELESKFGIFGRFAKGQDLVRELNGQSPAVVTTYESASRYLSNVQSGNFEMLILDEAHKIRNLHGGQNPPRIAVCIRNALQERLFKYVLMLTATPIQNRLWDLYSLIDCLTVAKGHRNPLGAPDAFKSFYIQDPSRGARHLVPGRAEAFRATLRQYITRTRREDAKLKFPSRVVRLMAVAPSGLEQRLHQLVAGLIDHLNGLQQSSILRALFSSPQALASQFENMAGRDSKWRAAAQQIRQWIAEDGETAKLRGLFQIISQLRREKPDDWRLVIFTIRHETQRAIGEALTRAGISYGFIQGGQPAANQATIKRFRADSPEIHVVVSSDAGAEGVNLQVANTLVNYDLPWNPMVVEQRIGRIQRLGAQFEHVVVVNLVVQHSAEAAVVARLMQKLQLIAHTVGDIEAILESASGIGGDEEETFESQIRDLILRSLKGQDVAQATALAERSIEQAQEMLERQREEIDATLGELNDLHTSGPAMPELEKVQPSMPVQQFVCDAIRASGGMIDDELDGTYTVRSPGRPDESVTFDETIWRQSLNEGVFMGTAPKLYLPGRTHFERLVQRWVDRSGHCVKDLTDESGALAAAMLSDWLGSIEGAQFSGTETLNSSPAFAGSFLCKARASNAVDSYEKLIDVQARPAGHAPVSREIEATSPLLTDSIKPDAIYPALRHQAAAAIEADADVNAFCHFYAARLSEEAQRTAGNAALRRKVEGDFSPQVFGEVLGLTGVRYAVERVRASFSIDGSPPYSCEFELIPATHQILRAPTMERCETSGRVVPEACLGRCAISGKRVLDHLLIASEDSGRKAIPELTAICEANGRRLLADEVVESSVTGARVSRQLCAKSDLSGRWALKTELVACTFSGSHVLPDELMRSEVSGKALRRDQAAASAASGTRGHHSEFIVCEATGDLVLESETARSDLSGRSVRADLLEPSSRPPHRLGTADERVVCEVTGKSLLKDEVNRCGVSDRLVDAQMLVTSDGDGRLALADEMVRCEVSGKRLLPDETRRSDVSGRLAHVRLLVPSALSGRLALGDEMRRCEMTGVHALPEELATSDLSGRPYRQDESVTSQISGRSGHKSEAVKTYDGFVVLSDEATPSQMSGKLIAEVTAITSEKTGRLGAPDEVGRCAVTGCVLLLDELSRCEVSGDLAETGLLKASSCSGRLALPQHIVRCEETRQFFLPDEVGRCSITHKTVDRRLLSASEEEPASFGLKNLMARCAASHRLVLPTELETCCVTGQGVLRRVLATCAVTGRRARRDRMVVSDESGALMLPDQAVRSVLDGSVGLPSEMVKCQWNEGPIRRSQARTCRRTGLTFAHDLVSAEGDLIVLQGLLTGELSGMDASDLLPWLRSQSGAQLASSKSAVGALSPRAGVRAVCVEIRSMMGLKVRHAGLLVQESGERAVIGRICVGRRVGNQWTPEA